jgi:CIC family chloride channel protein
LALLILFFPSLFGEGYQSIKLLSVQHPEDLLNNSLFQQFKHDEWFVLSMVGILIFLKSIATAITIGSGGNGGNFAPSLFVGSYLGFFLSKLANMLNLAALPVSNFTIVGMAGILSGLYHAPLTAIFLIAEITGGYTLMIPLMIVSSISFAVSKYFEPFAMDRKQISKTGNAFTFDKDQNVLATIHISELIETNFQPIALNSNLRDLVAVIAQSKRNIFPVTDLDGKLKGIIILENIRELMFKAEIYDKITVKELMSSPPAIVHKTDSIETVLQKFETTGAWNLPVVHNNLYIGFISKSSLLTNYRDKLKEITIL